MQRGVTLSNFVLMTTKNNELLLLLNYVFTFTYLADTFIQSDLQMRTMEAVKLYVM